MTTKIDFDLLYTKKNNLIKSMITDGWPLYFED